MAKRRCASAISPASDDVIDHPSAREGGNPSTVGTPMRRAVGHLASERQGPRERRSLEQSDYCTHGSARPLLVSTEISSRSADTDASTVNHCRTR
jgi:hypothetical protein